MRREVAEPCSSYTGGTEDGGPCRPCALQPKLFPQVPPSPTVDAAVPTQQGSQLPEYSGCVCAFGDLTPSAKEGVDAYEFQPTPTPTPPHDGCLWSSALAGEKGTELRASQLEIDASRFRLSWG